MAKPYARMASRVPKFPAPRAGRFGFEFSGGRLSLDFANTVGGRLRPQPNDHLVGYQDLVEWARQARLIDERGARNLERLARGEQAQAEAVLRRAKRLREAIFELFLAIASGRRPQASDVAEFNAQLSEALRHHHVARSGRQFEWSWDSGTDTLDRPLWPVSIDAAELLTSSTSGLVRACAADTCGWLFVDTTKNHSRRWCDMASCGNREKARRHYAKHPPA